jgi:hypothetical protein
MKLYYYAENERQIAPLFEQVKNKSISNIFLPQSFWDVLKMISNE